MAVIDGTPEVVDIIWLAGDTLTIAVHAPGSLTDGKTWNAHVKSATDAVVIDAEFDITPPTVSGGAAYLVLPAAITASLAGAGVPARIKNKSGFGTTAVQQYSGVWDCQLSVNGSDPVKTVAAGTLTIRQDVTRV